ncbi:MAG: tRNA pseudouridine(13) synthase TruD [Candidatus Altiarchaeales archaeon]|nr:tRNA pseudouridine(13) synthase TruD [Candidatus Altiarchaeales archaeon]MBD3416657.1 tRNA pseudouridine(13) synthase TruD [Candidatus Altiarchaeales archaeon]
MSTIKPPPEEVYVGLEEYKSSCEGIGGTLKREPGDFIVREITEEDKVLELDSDVSGDMLPGDYTHFTLVKENWDTMRAVKEISKALGVSRKRLAFAGTKDRRAVTAQRISAYKVPVEKLRGIRIKDLTLKDFGYSDESLGLGSLRGNRFTVKVRGVCSGADERIGKIAGEISSGFPNYYGRQRFGEARPITHEVGSFILKGDLESAVMTYLAKSFPGEDEGVRALREELWRSRDFQAALNSFPASMGYEKAILNHLIQYEEDYEGALKALPKSLQRMFVHAYQSYLFNRALSRCIRESYTVEKLPLVGFEVGADDISAGIMEADGIEQADFEVDGMRDLKSRGEYRLCFEAAKGIEWRVDGDDAVFSFSLSKGSYATVVIREFTKN